VMFFGVLVVCVSSTLEVSHAPHSGSETALFLELGRASVRSGVVSSGVEPECFLE
jgi:hypothetical protein